MHAVVQRDIGISSKMVRTDETVVIPGPSDAVEYFPNAPIVEAVLDIQFVPDKPVEMDNLAKIQSLLGEGYRTRRLQTTWTGHVEFKPGDPSKTKTSSEPVGYTFFSDDGKNAVMARRTGFAFSRLQPYTDWKQFETSARAAWKVYRSIVTPKSVNRVALRYINRLELPLPLPDLKEYLLTVPEIAPGLPQGMAHFFFRVLIVDQATGALAAITETVDMSGATETQIPVILDIDAYREGQFSTSTEKFWPMFDELHDFKNRIFFKTLTEKAKAAYR
jgi:uncharacterized protein (TIGR04255 family)